MKKPTKPVKPTKPKEPVEITTYDGPSPTYNLWNYSSYKLTQIFEDLKGQLPEGAAFDWSKVSIETEWSDDDSNTFVCYNEPNKVNYVDKKYKEKYSKYLKKLGKYEEDLKKFEIKSAQYVLDLVAYKDWVKNQEIKNAKKVLEKYKVKINS